METAILKAVPTILALFRQAMEIVTRGRVQSGKTAQEVFADAGVQLDENELALLADLEKYGS